MVKLCLLCHNIRVVHITKTCPCNIEKMFSVINIENFIRKKEIFLIF